MSTKKTITRFGTAYGRTIRERLASIEEGYRGKHKCPYCSYVTVTREAAGIWSCHQVQGEVHLARIPADKAYACQERPGGGGVNVQVLLCNKDSRMRTSKRARALHLLGSKIVFQARTSNSRSLQIGFNHNSQH